MICVISPVLNLHLMKVCPISYMYKKGLVNVKLKLNCLIFYIYRCDLKEMDYI